VLACVDVAAVRAFHAALRARGFADELAASDGAVRLYRPRMDVQDNASRHPLWPRTAQALAMPEDLAGLAGALAESAMQGMIPAQFFEAVAQHDRGGSIGA
jgi:hypothetical protein